jgi:hypothetical protein
MIFECKYQIEFLLCFIMHYAFFHMSIFNILAHIPKEGRI